MRNRPFSTTILLSALIATLVLGCARGPVAAHQPGTPAGGGNGVTTELLGRHPSAMAPGQALALMRVTFAPGSGVTAHTHPGDTVYHLEAGTLQFTLLDGEAQLVRASNSTAAVGTPSAAAAVRISEEVTLQVGDTIYYSSSAVQTERNDGDVDAVVLVANLRDMDEPARQFVEGTPTP